MTSFIYNGNDFGSVLEIEDVTMPAMPRINRDLVTVPGRDGAVLRGSQLGTRAFTIKARINAGSREPSAIAAAWSEIVPLLYTDEPAPLDLGEGRYYMAVLTGESPIEFHAYYGSVELSFECPDAYGHGAVFRASFPGSLHAGGNCPSYPVIRCANAVRASGSGLWGVRIDDGDFLRVPMGTGTHLVEIDCERRTVTLDGSTSMITLESDWIMVEPGEHTIAVDQGSGTGTIEWRERWL